MNPVVKFLSFVLTLTILVVSCAYAANYGYLNAVIKNAVIYYFSFKGIKAETSNLSFQHGNLSVSELSLEKGDSVVKITDLSANLGLSSDKFSFTLSKAYLAIQKQGGKSPSLTTNISASYEQSIWTNHLKTEFLGENISLPEHSDINNKFLPIGEAHFAYDSSAIMPKYDLSLNFGPSYHFNLSSYQDRIGFSGKVQNIPVLLYSIARDLAPEHGLLKFLGEFIGAGQILGGDFAWEEERGLSGKLKISKLDLKYDEYFPVLKDMDIDVILDGKKVEFVVNEAYSTKIKLYDGLITLDWKGDDTEIIVDAKGKGPAHELTTFINAESLDAMQQMNIDLTKLKGTVTADVKINIPLKVGTINKYNITADIPNANLNIFGDQVKLTKADIKGIFNGEQVILTGTGKINDFKSELSFVQNITDQSKYNHHLSISSYIKASEKAKKVGFLSLLKGESTLGFEYVNRDGQGKISAYSDLKNLELYFDKLGIRKNQGDSGKFTMLGKFDGPTKGSMEFNVFNEKDLGIFAGIHFKDHQMSIVFPKIKYKDTDLKAKATLKNRNFAATINGAELDLSDANMVQFLGKERDSGGTDLDVKIKKVKLKNNVLLDNLILKLSCDNIRCHAGYIDSKIGERNLEMLLTSQGTEMEQWVINCDDAGSLLKGLGAYNSMRSGKLNIVMNTSRKKVAAGELIPIHDGDFIFERFFIHDAPSITRLVSFVSIPGFVSTITNNKDISFSGMTGKFSFSGDNLTIKNSVAEGPYFDFTMRGDINTTNRTIVLKGHVTPSLYGTTSLLRSIPLIGRIVAGDKKNRGLVSAPYKIKQKY